MTPDGATLRMCSVRRALIVHPQVPPLGALKLSFLLSPPFASRNDILVRTADGWHVTLQEPLEFVTAAGLRYRAPAGTTSDGASTPSALWPRIPPFGSYWLAAVLHDAAYRDQLERWTGGVWVLANLTRDDADALLDEAMRSLDVPADLRIAIYEGVHFGGGAAFALDRGSSGGLY